MSDVLTNYIDYIQSVIKKYDLDVTSINRYVLEYSTSIDITTIGEQLGLDQYLGKYGLFYTFFPRMSSDEMNKYTAAIRDENYEKSDGMIYNILKTDKSLHARWKASTEKLMAYNTILAKKAENPMGPKDWHRKGIPFVRLKK